MFHFVTFHISPASRSVGLVSQNLWAWLLQIFYWAQGKDTDFRDVVKYQYICIVSESMDVPVPSKEEEEMSHLAPDSN